jgi:hypothetical protein
MDCSEHERLEQVLIQTRAESRKAVSAPGTEEFEQSILVEAQALENLKEHDAEHGCQR